MAVENKNTKERYNLPTEIKYCTKCTISNQRPRIQFDENGVCSACNYAVYKQTEIDWEKRDAELKALCDKFRKNDGSYDVLVPASGGKDSAYVAHMLKYKYNMNPLTCTWAPMKYTDIGFRNLQNMVHVGGLDNVMGTPDGNVHRLLTKLSLEILGDPFQPFIYGQTNYPLQVAAEKNIPLIMYGENGEVEYGGDMKNAHIPTRNYKTDHVKHYFSGIAPEDFAKHGLSLNDLKKYMPPSNESLEAIGTEVHFFGYYKKWVPQELYYYCQENTGFEANPVRSEGTYSKYASLDDKLDGYHYFLAYIKFGIGRCTSDSAHEIRDGHITREEGQALVAKYDGEFPQKNFQEFLEYCDITEDYFWEVIDSWRAEHLWTKVDGEWKVNYKVDGSGYLDK